MWAFRQFRMACAGPSVLGRDNLTEMRGEGDGETAAGTLQAQAGPVGTAVLHKPTVETCKRALTKDGSGEQANSHHPLCWEGLLHRDVKCYYTPLCPPLKEKNLNVSITKGFGDLFIAGKWLTTVALTSLLLASYPFPFLLREQAALERKSCSQGKTLDDRSRSLVKGIPA